MSRRLSSIRTLPDVALPHAQWLFDAIKTDRLTQKDMLAQFNARLASISMPPTSMSTLNRYAVAVRDGEVQRPSAIAPAIEGEVFAPAFRARLSSRLGEAAVRQFEALLFSLSRQDEHSS